MNHCSYTIQLNDDARFLCLKTILAYEAEVRGITKGKAFLELVLETVDIASYPEEMRERIEELARQRERRIVKDELAASAYERIA